MASGRVLAVSLALGALLMGCPAEKPPARAPAAAIAAPAQRLCHPHTVVLVRHAEKADGDPDEKDPELSPTGQQRASRLATLLGKSAPSRLVATEYKRTQHTLTPLAERVGKLVEVRSAAHTSDLVRELRDAPPGSTTVVATHSNVIPMLVRELGGGPLRDVGPDDTLPHDDFSRVLVLTLGCPTSPTLLELSSD